MPIEVRSTAFEEGRPIPLRHAQDGENVSPPLSIEGVPAAAQELVIIVDDPDAPTPEPWVHWVMYSVPADTATVPEGVPASARPAELAAAIQGQNTAGHVGYDGPAPPKGDGLHRYHFKVYAVDTKLELAPEANKQAVLDAIQGHILDQGKLVGTYER